jgi:polysaccharide export outer membrane protein
MYKNACLRYAVKCLLGLLLLASTSCRIYNQNILFRSNGDLISDQLLAKKMDIEGNYPVAPNDRLAFRVYSNAGEEIKWIPALDGMMMNNQLGAQQGVQQQMQQQMMNNPTLQQQNAHFSSFLVQDNGKVYLPVVGEVEVASLKLRQIDSLLALPEYFGKIYKGCFVRSQCVNNRVIVLKGEIGTVLPIQNENMTVIEAIAASGGVPNNVRAKNVRLIRGDLQAPNVYVIDLSTVEGLRRVNLRVQPNDIIYLEPVRKTVLESLNDISPFLGVITSVATLITTIILLNNR